MNKSLMILGGTGFFGRVLLDSYLNNDLKKFKINKLILVGNNFIQVKKILLHSKIKKKVLFLKKNLSKSKKLPYADYIIYAAEYVSYNKILTNYKNKNDLKVLNNSFKILSKNIFLKSKILYISSGAVYQKKKNKEKKKFTENDNLYLIDNSKLKNVNEIYLANKLIGEKKTIELSSKYKRKTSIVRCFALVGKFLPLNKQYAIGNFINSAINKTKIKIHDKSSKNVFRSYMSTGDLVKCLIKIVISLNTKCEIYNIGSDRAVSIWSLANYFAKKFKIKLSYPKQTNKKFDYYVPDIRKIKNKFKINITRNINQLIDRTLNEIKF
jgi:nucleoside-diphosphate-sugar epimerase